MPTILLIIILIVVYVGGTVTGHLNVRRSARNQVRAINASAQARIVGMSYTMAAESQRADEYQHGQRAMITHLETMLRAHAEYAEGLGTTANGLRLELTRYILGEVPENEIIEARANLLAMTAQNESRARHVQEPLMVPNPLPVEKNQNHVCGTPGSDCPRCGSCGADSRNIRYIVKWTQEEVDNANGAFGPLPCPDPWHDRPTDYEAADNYVAEGFTNVGGTPIPHEIVITAEHGDGSRSGVIGERLTQIELKRRHGVMCDCHLCIPIGD